jgi:hypothetical protein
MLARRPTRLVSELRDLERRIDTALSDKASTRLRRKLKTELLQVLNGTAQFDAIPAAVPNSGALTQRIYTRISEDANFALPRGIYEGTYFNGSVEHAVEKAGVHRSEWNYVNRLARELNVAPAFGQDDVTEPPAWMIDIDEAHQYLRVWIRELALQDMLLAGMESFLVPAGSGKPSTEIYGIVFGSYRMGGPNGHRSGVSMVDLNVERICIQHRAKGYPSEVIADERSEVTQLAMGEELFPYWHLLGDFHTHTYRDLKECYDRRGWHYSEFDEKVNIEWCEKLRELGHRPRVALIMTLTRAARQVNGTVENWQGYPHVVRATIGKCHCFIAAFRIRPDGRYSTENITLRCPHLAGQ